MMNMIKIRIANFLKISQRGWLMLCLWLSTTLPAFADNNDVTLSTPSASPLAKVVSGMQDIIDAIGGAGVTFIVFISAAFGVCLWILAPKQSQALGVILRVVVGGILLFNIALIISWLKG